MYVCVCFCMNVYLKNPPRNKDRVSNDGKKILEKKNAGGKSIEYGGTITVRNYIYSRKLHKILFNACNCNYFNRIHLPTVGKASVGLVSLFQQFIMVCAYVCVFVSVAK